MKKGCNYGPEPCRNCGKSHATPRIESKKIVKFCPVCGNFFVCYKSSHKIYCSFKCRHMVCITQICPVCKNPFESYKHEHRKFCSKKCSIIGQNHRDAEIVIKICPTCDMPFESRRKFHQIYCSKLCVYKNEEHGKNIKLSLINTWKRLDSGHNSQEFRHTQSEHMKEEYRNGCFDGCHTYPTKIERMTYNFLDSIHVLYLKQIHINLENATRIPDAFLPPDVIIEADGKQHFGKCHGMYKHISKKQIQKDRDTDPQLQELGYRIYRIPYWEFSNNKYKEILLKILKVGTKIN